MDNEGKIKIKVLGVGGGGCNIVSSMSRISNKDNIEFWCINSDHQALVTSAIADHTLLIGESWRGCGGIPENGRLAAEYSAEDIRSIVSDANLVFIVACEGGGTGTGAAPVIAKIAKKCGAIVVGIVTEPFEFEGNRRKKAAEEGIEALTKEADSIMVYRNDSIYDRTDSRLPIASSFDRINTKLAITPYYIAHIIGTYSILQVDFNDVRSLLEGGRRLYAGLAFSEDQGDAEGDAEQVLTDITFRGAAENGRKAIAFFTADRDLTINYIDSFLKKLKENMKNEVDIKLGLNVDDTTNMNAEAIVLVTESEGIR